MKSKPTPVTELVEAPTLSAIEALRRNLLHTMLSSVKSEDMEKIVEHQVQKATSGDTKAAVFVRDLLLKAAPPPSPPAKITVTPSEVDRRVDDWRSELRKGIGFYLTFAGPQTLSNIAERFGLDMVATEALLSCDMFHQDHHRWHMNNEARAQLLDGKAKMLGLGQAASPPDRDIAYNKDDDDEE